MLSTVTVTAQPGQELTDLATAKQHCRVDQSADDVLIGSYLRGSRVMAEMYTGRAFITQTLLWTMTPEDQLRRWNSRLRGPLTLPRGPVQSVASVIVTDTLGNTTPISPATLPIVPPAVLLGYMTDCAHIRGRLTIGPDTILIDGRTVRQVELQHIQVSFVAGFGDTPSAVPAPIIDAVLLTTAFLYEHRGDAGGELPQAMQWLLDPYRVVPI
jgi:hypothetical protein